MKSTERPCKGRTLMEEMESLLSKTLGTSLMTEGDKRMTRFWLEQAMKRHNEQIIQGD